MSTSLLERFDTTPEIRTVLDTAGLRAQDMASVDPESLAGPLVVVRLIAADDPSRTAIVATSADADPDVARALVDAATTDDPELEPQPEESSPDMSSLRDSAGIPLTDSGIGIATSEGELVGVVLVADDRRSASGGASAGPDGGPGSSGPGGSGSSVSTAAFAGGAPFGAMTMLRDVLLDVTVELGRATMPLVDLMSLDVGSLVELDRPTGSPVDIRVNGVLLGRGEVVVVDNEYAVRVVEVLDPAAEGH